MADDVQEQLIRFPGYSAEETATEEVELRPEDIARHKRISLPFFFIWISLMAFGFIMMFSASFGESFVNTSSYINVIEDEAALQDLPEALRTEVVADATASAARQLRLSIIGSIIAIIIALFVPFRQLLRPRLRTILYLIITLLLFYTAFKGVTSQGAQRWVVIGFIQFQPSELAKIGVVYYLSSYFYERQQLRKNKAGMEVARGKKTESELKKKHRETFYDFTRPLLLMGLWVILVLLQPHMSGAIILTVLTVLMFLMGKIPAESFVRGLLLHAIPLLLVALLLFSLFIPVFYDKSLPEFVSERFAHSQKRLDLFRDRDSVDADGRRQVEQAEIAFGVGGLTGVGLGRSTQKLNWLAEAHNDFIFPIIGEELGLIGTLAVLLIFMLFLIGGFSIAARASNMAARNIAAGFTFLIVFQAFLNMAVATSLIPATGISLPFFSAGGTANIIFALAAALILCVSKTGVQRNPELVRVLDQHKS
ncbi:MAG: FtsW/RodA/SpoVE family cell cycle protein [Clostridiaceae bacterium]|jgi:cell division protein FtsW|nr:FtsW/RodA/SpoVE family cell cycle protein [Clostridiaceae bacterium]